MMKRLLNKDVLVELLRTGGISFKETSTSFLFDCPKCGKKEKLAMHKYEGYWCCYRCKDDGFKGRPEVILSLLLDRPIVEICKLIYPNFGTVKQETIIDIDLLDPWEEEVSEPDNFGLDFMPTDGDPVFVGPDHKLFAAGRKYLIEERGLTEEIIRTYNIMYNPNRHAVVFPVEYQGGLYGWQERGVYANFKYTMKGFPKERIVMFMDRLDNSNHAIITEGPVDALKCHALGGNVATMGKNVSDRQLDLVKARVNRIYIALDPDAASVINNLCQKLVGDKEVFIMTPPEGRKDFGECTEEEVKNAFDNATQFFGQKFIHLKGIYGRK